LLGDAEGVGEDELDFVVVCAVSDKERTRGTTAAIR
jgi:hypothetical protein